MEYMTGIYSILNLKNGKRYIGSSARLERRWVEHKSALRRHVHVNSYLQRSYDKHGEEQFTFEIVEHCDNTQLIEREEFWISHFQSHKKQFGYNLSLYPSRPRLGVKASPETIKKMSIANGGVNHPNWGKKLSKEWRKNISQGQKGIKKPTSGVRKSVWVIDPSGKVVEVKGIREFCRKMHFTLSGFWLMTIGKTPSYKGWTKK